MKICQSFMIPVKCHYAYKIVIGWQEMSTYIVWKSIPRVCLPTEKRQPPRGKFRWSCVWRQNSILGFKQLVNNLGWSTPYSVCTYVYCIINIVSIASPGMAKSYAISGHGDFFFSRSGMRNKLVHVDPGFVPYKIPTTLYGVLLYILRIQLNVTWLLRG